MDDHVPMDPEATAELRRAVDRARPIHATVQGVFRAPQPGSIAASDAAIPHARWVLLSADMALGVASDRLTAWKLLVESRLIPIYSPMALFRGRPRERSSAGGWWTLLPIRWNESASTASCGW